MTSPGHVQAGGMLAGQYRRTLENAFPGREMRGADSAPSAPGRALTVRRQPGPARQFELLARMFARYISSGGGGSSTPHGARHAVAVSQKPAQMPDRGIGAQADPGGNPSATQSASRLQTAQFRLSLYTPCEQKLLPAVVR